MKENQFSDKKSLRLVTGNSADWQELAKDCVCFANSRGGDIFIGIENHEKLPPAEQVIDPDLPFKIRKRISENTVNVGLEPTILTAENGGQYIRLTILQSASTIASTSDGKYYYRSADSCIPLLPDELSRLFTDKPSFIWETKPTRIPKTQVDPQKLQSFVHDIRGSRRVSVHVKQKSTEELLEHYHFSTGEVLTNLGILWIGQRNDRSNLLYAPTIQFFKPDILTFLKRADEDYGLLQKERICLGLIAQHNSLSSLEFSRRLDLPDQPNAIRHWLGRLTELDIVRSKGKTRGTEYFVNPDFLKKANFKGRTTLKTIEPHRLRELILTDLSIYEIAHINDIHTRIGKEIPLRRLKTALDQMCAEGELNKSGVNRWTKYSLNIIL